MDVIVQQERVQKRLKIVQWAALVDLVLLVVLVASAITGQRDLVHVLGPIHGINFLLLIVIAGVAVLDGLWGWWFPLLIFFTAGPPGAFIGEWIVGKHLKEQANRQSLHNQGGSESAMDTTEELA